jgi:type IV pilus assembly protein PilE
MNKLARSSQRGITLIELMTVVVIVAVLASIAIPSYRSYLLRSQRTDARALLVKVQASQERFLLQQNRYATDAELTVTPPQGLGQSRESENRFYTLQIAAGATPTEYTLIARPRAGGGQQDDDKCVEFSIDQNGIKRAEDSSGADVTNDCWR